MDKIDVFHIILNHLKTLRNIRTGKTSCSDIFVFFVWPFLFSVTFVFFDISINPIIGDLLKAIAIFSAFLFNMLAIVNSSLNNEKIKADGVKGVYAKEIHTNLSFEILTGIFLVIFLILQSMLIKLSDCDLVFYLRKIVEVINLSLLGVFLLTLIMCLNRVYILLRY